jgi:hypothetical protein
VVAVACYRLAARAANDAWTTDMQALAEDAQPEAMMVALTDMLARTAGFEALLVRWSQTHQRLSRALR